MVDEVLSWHLLYTNNPVEEMSRSTVRKTVELDEDNVDWFYKSYGEVGGKPSLSWVLDLMLAEFRKAHERSPAELAAIGAAELKRILEE